MSEWDWGMTHPSFNVWTYRFDRNLRRISTALETVLRILPIWKSGYWQILPSALCPLTSALSGLY
jgi:hypothetical protein